ncbi:MAG TPA: hypothetical protein PLP61_00995 [Nocardioides sp.]|uniref:hypothetical protein n=1 Tax=Nocardioides sp. TaxID=35761 RepID=UPI002D1B0273|nr:hypothetical protein [Nocardioides sp.]HQR25587.1 hypothetical protein [Nocardioides sp.]
MQVRRARAALLAWLPVLALAALLFVSPPPSSAKRVAGSLDLAPNQFYGGQGVTFKGGLGSAGSQTIWLEYNMNRPGDAWTRIEGFTTSTDANGQFDFTYPARSMLNISLRVSSAGIATPAVKSQADDQELALSVVPSDSRVLRVFGSREYLRYPAVAGQSFVVKVDTSPKGTPVLVGRTVTLQERLDNGQWQSVGTDTVDRDGFAQFQRTVSSAGEVVYRARAEDWTAGGSEIGWFPSYPTYVEVHRPEELARKVASATQQQTGAESAEVTR